MAMGEVQKKLDQKQIEAFYVSHFAADQVTHFKSLLKTDKMRFSKTVVDVGGGCGFFARHLIEETGLQVRVLDTDAQSVATCHEQSIEAVCDDALAPRIVGDEEIVCFNLILHHLIAEDDKSTEQLQKKALNVWRANANYIFVNEYVYDSFIGNLSGRIIYEVTRNRLLSNIGKLVSRFVPSLRANTFGIGVRFRSHSEWEALFLESGFRVVSRIKGQVEPLSLARRLLLINEKRRDSFLLSPVA
jgi:hypothetical protein